MSKPSFRDRLFRRKRLTTIEVGLREVHRALRSNKRKPWTLEMAYYACGGGIILQRQGSETQRRLSGSAVLMYADLDPASLEGFDHNKVVDRSKLNALGKFLSALQAVWFFAQCGSRLYQGLAISLLELVTIGHCIAACCIYVLWLNKPYDVSTHVTIDSEVVPMEYLLLLDALKVSKKDVFERSLRLVEARSGEDPYLNSTLGYLNYDKRWLLPASFNIPGTELKLLHENPPSRYEILTMPPGLDPWTSASLRAFQRLWKLRQTNPQVCDLAATYDGTAKLQGEWRFSSDAIEESFGPLSTVCVVVACALYRALYLLAWDYKFTTETQRDLWRKASVFSAVAGIAVPVLFLVLSDKTRRKLSCLWFVLCLTAVTGITEVTFFLIPVDILVRTFLEVESFVALPNSDPSVYQIPLWSAYFPHF